MKPNNKEEALEWLEEFTTNVSDQTMEAARAAVKFLKQDDIREKKMVRIQLTLGSEDVALFIDGLSLLRSAFPDKMIENDVGNLVRKAYNRVVVERREEVHALIARSNFMEAFLNLNGLFGNFSDWLARMKVTR